MNLYLTMTPFMYKAINMVMCYDMHLRDYMPNYHFDEVDFHFSQTPTHKLVKIN